MEDGYEIFWTDLALKELKATFEYLEDRFTKKEIQRLSFFSNRQSPKSMKIYKST